MKKSNDIENNHLSVFKRLVLLFVIIILLFAAINLVWFLGYKYIYNEISNQMEGTYIEGIQEPQMLRYTMVYGEYTFSLKHPAYLGEGGFLSVGKTEGYVEALDEKGNPTNNGMSITFYVWPKYFNRFEYGIDFYYPAEGIWEQVEIDSNMRILNVENLDDVQIEYLYQLLEDNKDEIEKLISVTKEALEIDFYS